MKAARSNRRAIRIVSQCATSEEFVAAFHPYLERGSLFIATGSPEEPGQVVRFVLTLAGGETVLRGLGRVIETHRDRGNFYGLRGMKLQFDELDEGSRRALAALESRAGKPKARSARGGAPAADVIECLIYDDPEVQPESPASAGGRHAGGRSAAAEHALPLGDDDVTAVSLGPPRSPDGEPPPRPSRAPRAAAAAAAPMASLSAPGSGPHRATPAPLAPGSPPPGLAELVHMSSFVVPRPATIPEDDDGATPPSSPAPISGSLDLVAEMTTDLMPALPPHGGTMSAVHGVVGEALPALSPRGPTAMASPELGTDEANGARPWGSPEVGTDEANGPRPWGALAPHGLPSRPADPRVPPPHMMMTDPGGFPPADFAMPATRPGARRVAPQPPMPAERTELVRIARPSYVRTAAVSATVGALLGLGAGYLLWGMNHFPSRRTDQAGAPGETRSANAAPAPAPEPDAAPAADAGPPAGADAGPVIPAKPPRKR